MDPSSRLANRSVLNVPISDDTLLRLKELAAEQKLTVEEYISRMTDHVARQPAGDFDEIAARILAKNKELYDRLASQSKLRSLRGTVKWEGDLNALRTTPPTG